MLQNPCKTLGFNKNMVYKIPLGGGGKPYPASGLNKCKIQIIYRDVVRSQYTTFQNKFNSFIVNAPFFH